MTSPSLRRDGSKGAPTSAPRNRQSQRARTDVRFTQRARAGARRPRSWPSIPQDRRAGPGKSRRRGGTQGPSLNLGPGPPRHPRPPYSPGTRSGRVVQRPSALGVHPGLAPGAKKGAPGTGGRDLRRGPENAARAHPPPTSPHAAVQDSSCPSLCPAPSHPPGPARAATSAAVPHSPSPSMNRSTRCGRDPPAASRGSQTTFPTRPRGRGVFFGVRRRRPNTARSDSSHWSEVDPRTALLG